MKEIFYAEHIDDVAELSDAKFMLNSSKPQIIFMFKIDSVVAKSVCVTL